MSINGEIQAMSLRTTISTTQALPMTHAMTLQLAGSVSLQAVSERRRDECLRARPQSETDPDDADDANDGECATICEGTGHR